MELSCASTARKHFDVKLSSVAVVAQEWAVLVIELWPLLLASGIQKPCWPQMSIPDLASLPVIVGSKGNREFSSARVLQKYFPHNIKYCIVPQSECASYRQSLSVWAPEFRVLSEPSPGLAAADA